MKPRAESDSLLSISSPISFITSLNSSPSSQFNGLTRKQSWQNHQQPRQTDRYDPSTSSVCRPRQYYWMIRKIMSIPWGKADPMEQQARLARPAHFCQVTSIPDTEPTSRNTSNCSYPSNCILAFRSLGVPSAVPSPEEVSVTQCICLWAMSKVRQCMGHEIFLTPHPMLFEI